MTFVALLLAGLGAVLAARARLAAGTGAYWLAWSFRERAASAAGALLELVFWPFAVGVVGGAAAVAVSSQASDATLVHLLSSVLVGVGAGAVLAVAGKGDDSRNAVIRTLLQRQEERLDQLAHEGLDAWLTALGPLGLQEVARMALRRRLSRYARSPLSPAQIQQAGEVAKVTVHESREAFRAHPADTDARDDFQNLALGLVREQRLAIRKKRRREFESVG
jgi:hypothetical protein